MDVLKRLFEQHFHSPAEHVRPLQGQLGGSGRNIIRLAGSGQTAVGILYSVREENLAFLEFSRHFRRHGLSVPEIYAEDLAQLEVVAGSETLRSEVTHFAESIDGTCLAHLQSGLFEAQARDEAGWEAKAGHRDMWFAARDVAFEKLKAMGVRRINGNIVGDDTWFDSQGMAPGWAWDDEQYSDASPPSGLNVNENLVEVFIRPGAKVGDPARKSTSAT